MPLSIAYSLSLTRDEYKTLLWLEGRGYAANLIHHATAYDEIEGQDQIILVYTEPAAWAVAEDYESDPHAFGACAAPELKKKMTSFLERIV